MSVVRYRTRLPEYIATLNPRLGATLRQGAEMVADRARSRVHVDSGDLRDAIHVESEPEDEFDLSYYVVAGSREAYYGHMEEFGTSDTPAHPFLVPALEEMREPVVVACGKSLGRF